MVLVCHWGWRHRSWQAPLEHHVSWAIAGVVALVALTSRPLAAHAQGFFTPTSRFELSESVQIDKIDSNARGALEAIEGFIEGEEWEDALDALSRLADEQGQKLVAWTPRRYTRLADYLHWRISHLPAKALAIYRRRVDPQARQWLEQGLDHRDRELLSRIVEQSFCSKYGDDALAALGAMALEAADYGAARGYFERLQSPARWLQRYPNLADDQGRPLILTFPDSEIEASQIEANTILVAILAGEEGAGRALARFQAEFPAAKGRMGGKSVELATFLKELLSATPAPSAPHSNAVTNADWPTFAGDPTRNRALTHPIQLGALRWRVDLPRPPAVEYGYQPRRVAEDHEHLLSHHPIVVGDVVLLNDLREIRAYKLSAREPTGAAAWGTDPVIPLSDGTPSAENQRTPRAAWGVPRYTMTARGRWLYARLGNPVTSARQEPIGRRDPSFLVCLDLQKQGSLRWKIEPPEDGWSFEGAPVADGSSVYVGLRRGDLQPIEHVACYDAQTGQPRWRTFVCGAETPAQGMGEEITSNLLCLDHETLYVNTNLGGVAALNKRDGHVRWLSLYARAKGGDSNARAKHFFRDLTPCLFDRGRIFVAPSDSKQILALDAETGLTLWETSLADDVVHLLGVGGGNLIASGDKLWWIRVETGKLASTGWSDGAWPDGGSPKGFGRGLLAADKVYWPTRDKIHVFDQKSGQKLSEIELSTRGGDPIREPLMGGNLVSVGGSLLVATCGQENGKAIESLLVFDSGPAVGASNAGESR